MQTPELPTATACPSCESETHARAHGVIAPFLTELASLPRGSETDLRVCVNCGLSFFSARYRDRDLARLYLGYRGDRYTTIRRRWEPWYSHKVNDAYSTDGPALRDRRDFMNGILLAAGMEEAIDCAVDFGGDAGQFFPDVQIQRRVLVDPSERALPQGVERIAALDPPPDFRPDLVIVAHVLEHLPDPRKPLDEIREILADDGIVYVEVPLDKFSTHPSQALPKYQRYLQFLSRRRAFFVPIDFLTGIWRQYWHRVPRLGIVKQSEHINYFSPESLRDLLARTGFSVVSEQHDPGAPIGRLKIGRYGVAARAVEANE